MKKLREADNIIEAKKKKCKIYEMKSQKKDYSTIDFDQKQKFRNEIKNTIENSRKQLQVMKIMQQK